jgi:hypothetical protein
MQPERRYTPPASIAALLADVDGTLVNKEKALTARAIEAVHHLREHGISGRVSPRPAPSPITST